MDPAVRGSMRTYTVRELAAGLRLSRDRRRLRDALRRRRPRRARRQLGPERQAGRRRSPSSAPTTAPRSASTAETYGGIEWRPGLAQRVLLAGDETADPRHLRHPRKPAVLHDRPRLPGGPGGRRLPGAHVRRPTSRSPGLPAARPSDAHARTASCCRRPCARPSPCPAGWASRRPTAARAPSLRTSTWTWTSSGRLPRGWKPPRSRPAKNPDHARRRHALLRLDRRRSRRHQGHAAVPGAGCRHRPEAGRVHGVLAAGQSRRVVPRPGTLSQLDAGCSGDPLSPVTGLTRTLSHCWSPAVYPWVALDA